MTDLTLERDHGLIYQEAEGGIVHCHETIPDHVEQLLHFLKTVEARFPSLRQGCVIHKVEVQYAPQKRLHSERDTFAYGRTANEYSVRTHDTR